MTRSANTTEQRHGGAELYTEPFHLALRTAIRERGLTLERLRAHLARRGISVGLSSLSNWQTGHARPETAGSLRAVQALEEILGLPPDSLVRLLPVVDTTVHPPRRVGLTDIAPVTDLLITVPDALDEGLTLVGVQHKIVVDAERRSTSIWTRAAVRATRDGVDRYVARYYGNSGCLPALVRPSSLANCRLGRFMPHPSAPALVYELLFGHALRTGETWVFECELVDPTAGVSHEFAYGFRYPAEQYVLEVRFHPRARPTACYSFAQRDLTDDRHRTAQLNLSPHNTVHLVASAVSSGVLGIQWEWPQSI
jgi:hypothetical protein